MVIERVPFTGGDVSDGLVRLGCSTRLVTEQCKNHLSKKGIYLVLNYLELADVDLTKLISS